MKRNLIRRICFIAIGISAFVDPLDIFNPYRMLFGAITGLMFGWIFRKVLRVFIGLFNSKFKKEQGKESIRDVVDTGMTFLVPFTIMLLFSVYFLNWSETRGFIAAGIMAVTTGVTIELGKIKASQEIKNTFLTSAIGFLFSFIWSISYAYLAKAPSLFEGGILILREMIGKGGLGL